MTASERLRALDGAMRFDTPTDCATFVRGRDAEHEILRALPLIADALGEYEALLPPEGHHRLCASRGAAVADRRAPKCDCHMRRFRALTALQEHLEGGGA